MRDVDRAPLRVTVVDLPSSATEGSQAALLQLHDSLRKVSVIYYGESGKVTECYYVLADQPRFLVRTETRYTRPMSGKVRSETTERVRLGPDSVFRWQDARGRQVLSDSTLADKGRAVRLDFRALVATTHEGYRSRERMPHVPCR
jgi:hypothetical protein